MRRNTRLFDQEPKQSCLVVFELSPNGSKSRSTFGELLMQEHVQGTRRSHRRLEKRKMYKKEREVRQIKGSTHAIVEFWVG